MKSVSIEVDSAFGPIEVQTFSDKSASIIQSVGAVSTGKTQSRRKLARTLSPVYVVKSDSGNYGGLAPRLDAELTKDLGWGRTYEWVESQKEAVRFTSKKAASVVAKAFPHAGARVVRLK